MNYNPFKSRTNITIAIAILIGGANAVIPFLSPEWQGLVTAVLGALAVYFHTDTAVKAGAIN